MVHQIFHALLELGPLGLFLLSVLDSSFLFVPIGNDLLLVALVARNHAYLILDVLSAAFGSATGVLLLDLVSRKGGEDGLAKLLSHKRWTFLKKKMKEHAGIVLVAACLAPPPFPFTAMVAAASALQYPRLRLLAVVFGARVLRFSIVGLAALWLHRDILRIASSKGFLWFMEGFIALCVVGSVLSILRWIRLSRSR